MRRALLVHNPTAGAQAWPRSSTGRRSPAAVRAELERGGWAIEPAPTAGRGGATALARRAVAEGLDAVFVLGGDGTVREAAAGLLGSAVALGPLPGGTTNVVARSLGLPLDPVAAAAVLAGAAPRPIDVGLCGGEPFLMQASTGLDAHVMANLDPAIKGRLGQLGVALAGIGHWWAYGYPELRLTADGVEHQATLAVVVNLPHYAGAFQIVPAADPADGQLELLLFRGRGRRAALGFALDLARGAHLRRPDVTVLPVLRVELSGGGGTSIQIDGDACGAAPPVAIELAKERLLVLRV